VGRGGFCSLLGAPADRYGPVIRRSARTADDRGRDAGVRATSGDIEYGDLDIALTVRVSRLVNLINERLQISVDLDRAAGWVRRISRVEDWDRHDGVACRDEISVLRRVSRSPGDLHWIKRPRRFVESVLPLAIAR